MIVRNVARVVLFAIGVALLAGFFADDEVAGLMQIAGFAIVIGVPLQWMIVSKPEWIEKITKPLDR